VKLKNILYEFSPNDAWVDPDGKLHVLHYRVTHEDWLEDNTDVEPDEAMEKGWIALSASNVVWGLKKWIAKNAKTINKYIQGTMMRNHPVTVKVESGSGKWLDFNVKYDLVLGYGIAKVVKNPIKILKMHKYD